MKVFHGTGGPLGTGPVLPVVVAASLLQRQRARDLCGILLWVSCQEHARPPSAAAGSWGADSPQGRAQSAFQAARAGLCFLESEQVLPSC